jgi:hypothetical protein
VTHLIDENGVSHFRKRVVNDLDNIVTLLTPFRDSLVGLVVESSYNLVLVGRRIDGRRVYSPLGEYGCDRAIVRIKARR